MIDCGRDEALCPTEFPLPEVFFMFVCYTAFGKNELKLLTISAQLRKGRAEVDIFLKPKTSLSLCRIPKPE